MLGNITTLKECLITCINNVKEKAYISWVKHDKHNFTQNPYEPDWQFPLGVRASG